MSNPFVSSSRRQIRQEIVCYKALISRAYYEPARELAMADLVWRQRTPAVDWTSFTLHRRHNLAYTGRRRRCRGLGRCAGVCWAMSVANRNRSSTRKCERPADVRTNESGGAMLVDAVGRYRSSPPSSRKQTRSSPQARYWSISRSSRP